MIQLADFGYKKIIPCLNQTPQAEACATLIHWPAALRSRIGLNVPKKNAREDFPGVSV